MRPADDGIFADAESPADFRRREVIRPHHDQRLVALPRPGARIGTSGRRPGAERRTELLESRRWFDMRPGMRRDRGLRTVGARLQQIRHRSPPGADVAHQNMSDISILKDQFQLVSKHSWLTRVKRLSTLLARVAAPRWGARRMSTFGTMRTRTRLRGALYPSGETNGGNGCVARPRTGYRWKPLTIEPARTITSCRGSAAPVPDAPRRWFVRTRAARRRRRSRLPVARRSATWPRRVRPAG